MKTNANLSQKVLKSLSCCILAAGEGTRMNSSLPKVLHKIYNRPLIDYIFDVLKKLKINKIVTIVGYKSGQIQDYVKKDSRVIKQKKLLGTADALKQAKGELSQTSGNVLVLCADTPLIKPQTLKKLIVWHIESGAGCTLLTGQLKNPTGYGRILRNNNGKIVKIIEEKNASLYEKVITEVNTGIYCFKNKDLFKYLDEIKPDKIKKEYYLTDIIEVLSRKGLKIESLKSEDSEEALGINTREDLSLAHKVLKKRVQEEIVSRGVTIIDPDSTHINVGVEIGKDTIIEPFVRIEEDVKIGTRCWIGPFARIRPKTVIKDNVRIGNFVEVVRSRIGSSTKINHHSYIGDSEVGRNVNIGAGTITANYDGRKKNKTIIKDGAFIGSGTILVAPVKIGKNAVTGANCVVNKKEVKDDQVVVGVPAKVLRKRKK
jgi:bifunctional UDP-N-acetylglucosamine pyrophosphorylase / glucosamine-1-phosphate N-acetyltransferase